MAETLRAMQMNRPGARLETKTLERRDPKPGEVRIKVLACAVCRTDLHIMDGELAHPKLPLVPGHEIVGRIEALGPGVSGIKPVLKQGDRVGVPWLCWTCGVCEYCRTGRENLCPRARFTGYDIDGGFSDLTYADARYVFPLPAFYGDEEAAPLLCAGLIGWRALKAAGPGKTLGLYGFGAAAHIAVQAARHRGQQVFAFVRPGDAKARDFAIRMGAVWAGDSDQPAPEPLDAAIIFAPVGALVPAALAAIKPGGSVVCGGIHMSDIPSFPYAELWHERVLRSVANLTRADAEEFLDLAPRIPVRCETLHYALESANQALDDVRAGRLSGAAVLVP
jgi:alcohol dehydrogenase, propanol-preferring